MFSFLGVGVGGLTATPSFPVSTDPPLARFRFTNSLFCQNGIEHCPGRWGNFFPSSSPREKAQASSREKCQGEA